MKKYIGVVLSEHEISVTSGGDFITCYCKFEKSEWVAVRTVTSVDECRNICCVEREDTEYRAFCARGTCYTAEQLRDADYYIYDYHGP